MREAPETPTAPMGSRAKRQQLMVELEAAEPAEQPRFLVWPSPPPHRVEQAEEGRPPEVPEEVREPPEAQAKPRQWLARATAATEGWPPWEPATAVVPTAR